MPGKHMAPSAKPSTDSGAHSASHGGAHSAGGSSSGGRRFRTETAAQSASQTAYKPAQAQKKPHRLRRVLSTLLIVLGVVLLLVAGGMWGYSRYRYWVQDKTNKKLAEHVKIVEVTEAEDTNTCPVEVDWDALKAVNSDVVGWIHVPGTVVSYPVYQGEDNDEYLRTNALGEWSVGGQIFLDWENTPPGMKDFQSILYGHHLYDGTMFQPLSLLDDQEVFDATDTIWYITEEKAYELEPLFMYWVDPTDETVRQFRFSSVEEFRKYLSQQLAKAVTRRADADQLVASAQRVLTMSTCNYYDGYGRSILVAIEKNPEPLAAPAATVVTTTPEPTPAPEPEVTAEQETTEEYTEETYDEYVEYEEDTGYYEDEAY